MNGASERLNRTLLNYARTLILDSKLPKGAWAEAISFSAHILNCVKFIDPPGKTPFEIITGQKPYLDRVLPFGTRVFFYDRKPSRDKLSARAKEGTITGIDEDGRSYRILELGTTTVHRVPDVIVKKKGMTVDNVEQLPYEPLSKEPPAVEENPTSTTSTLDNNIEEEEPPPLDAEMDSNETDDIVGAREVDAELGLPPGDEPDVEEEAVTKGPRRRKGKSSVREDNEPAEETRTLRDRSTRSKPDRYGDWELFQASSVNTHDNKSTCIGNSEPVPTNLKEVNDSRNKTEWWAAMSEEMASISYHKVWDLTPPPPNRKILGCRWVFSVKTDKDGHISRRKARLCLKGYAQKPGIDYTEVFSPVARFETIRCVLAISAKERLTLYQFDVKTAFLSADIDVDLFMHQPEGFNDKGGRVCHLRRALYGAVQSPRAFNQKISKTLLSLKTVKLVQSHADPCLFFSKPPRRIVALIYVDDGMVAGTDEKLIKDFINELGKTFQLTSKPLEYFLGLRIQISPDKRRIHVDQARYIDELLERFKMTDCKPAVVPIDSTFRAACEGEIDVNLQYRQAVGGLMYACLATRADCAYTVGVLSRYLDKPTKALWNSAMKALRYLKGTKTYGLTFTDSGKNEMVAYSDADWGGCHSTFRSTTGAFIQFGGGAIAWVSQRQAMVTLSTLESELVAASETAKTVIWLNRLLSEAGYTVTPRLLIDNQAVIHLIGNPQASRRCKHISIRHYFVRERAQEGDFTVKHCASEQNSADLFTKILPKSTFQRLRTSIGLLSPENDQRTHRSASRN